MHIRTVLDGSSLDFKVGAQIPPPHTSPFSADVTDKSVTADLKSKELILKFFVIRLHFEDVLTIRISEELSGVSAD